MNKKLMSVAVFLLAVLVLAACGGGSTSTTAMDPSSAAAPGTEIAVEAFGPEAEEVLSAIEILLAEKFGEDD